MYYRVTYQAKPVLCRALSFRGVAFWIACAAAQGQPYVPQSGHCGSLDVPHNPVRGIVCEKGVRYPTWTRCTDADGDCRTSNC